MTNNLTTANDRSKILGSQDATWSLIQGQPSNTASRGRNLPIPKSRSHLPIAQQNRSDAIESEAPMMRITWQPMPRAQNPAHQHLQNMESSDGARSVMYLLNHVARMFGAPDYEHLYWADLRPSAITSVLSILRDNGYKPSSRNAYLSALKSCARESWVLKQMEFEDYEIIKQHKRVKQHKEPAGRALEFSVLMDIVDFTLNVENRLTKNRDALMLQVMIFTGVRRGELAQLYYPTDFDFLKCQLRIKGKGNKVRLAILPTEIADQLNDYIHQERGLEPGAIFCPYWNKRKTPKINQTGVDISTVNRILERILKAFITHQEQLEDSQKLKASPHDIRRSFATIMNDQGIPVTKIQDLMGHAKVETTQSYIRDNKEEYRESAAHVGSELLKARNRNKIS